MKAALIAFVLLTTSAAAADNLYPLYAAGKYEEAVKAGVAEADAPGYAIAARAVLAEAVLAPAPCMACLKRAEDFARKAVAADPANADGQVWLAVSLGYQARITGAVVARLHDAPGQSKAALEAAVKAAPDNPFAVSALGGWHIEVVRGGGAFMAGLLYGAKESTALSLFDRAVHLAPGNVAVRYQIGLSLSGFDPDKYRARIDSELQAATKAVPASLYEKAMQGRAGELLALLRAGAADKFAALVHKYQGYPE